MSAETWRAIGYRVGQFSRALVARPLAEELHNVADILSPQAQQVFLRQPAADQRHALAVCRALKEQGESNPHLLAAALLHDAGKTGAGLSPVHRAAVVVLEHWAPAALARVSREGQAGQSVPGWRKPFVRHAGHAHAGASWARQAGCSDLTVALIERHHQPAVVTHGEEERLLAALQDADRRN